MNRPLLSRRIFPLKGTISRGFKVHAISTNDVQFHRNEKKTSEFWQPVLCAEIKNLSSFSLCFLYFEMIQSMCITQWIKKIIVLCKILRKLLVFHQMVDFKFTMKASGADRANLACRVHTQRSKSLPFSKNWDIIYLLAFYYKINTQTCKKWHAVEC